MHGLKYNNNKKKKKKKKKRKKKKNNNNNNSSNNNKIKKKKKYNNNNNNIRVLNRFFVTGVFVFLSDVNECTEGTHLCSTNAVCINQVGTYACTCKSGFSGNGSICTGELAHTPVLRLIKSR